MNRRMNELGNIIDLLGIRLAEFTNKPVMACRGLIRLALKDRFKDYTRRILTYQDFEHILEHQLTKRLEILSIPQIPEIIKKMTTYLTEIQGLITMLSI